MVIFPYRHHGCLGVRKLREYLRSSKNVFCGVKYVTLVPYKAVPELESVTNKIILNASKWEGIIPNLLSASFISTRWKLLSSSKYLYASNKVFSIFAKGNHFGSLVMSQGI